MEIAAYQGLSEMESEIYIVRCCLLLCTINWNFWKMWQCLPIWEFEIFCRAILISFQYPSLILLNNVFVIQNFSLNLGWELCLKPGNIFPHIVHSHALVLFKENIYMSPDLLFALIVEMPHMNELDIEII